MMVDWYCANPWQGCRANGQERGNLVGAQEEAWILRQTPLPATTMVTGSLVTKITDYLQIPEVTAKGRAGKEHRGGCKKG